ncbi:MAG: AAA family ATPase [Chloroflexota bacterium]
MDHGRAGRTDLPTGTVTFLRTDVEGSMALARVLGAGWDAVNAKHLGIIRRAVDAQRGVCVRTEGDAFFGAFAEAGAAVTAAIDAQRTLSGHAWPPETPIHVRMGLHTGEAHLAGDDYGGFEVNRVARIAAAGHGGQILVSEPTRLLADHVLSNGIGVRDLGGHVLRDVPAPERLFQVEVPGLRNEFPPLRTARPTAGNLPDRLTSFLGRERELAELSHILSANRLLTLTGPGGTGKTSLAVELGRAWLDRVPDGVWLVGLDAVAEPSLVRAEIARTLGLFDGPDRPAADALESYLTDRSTLLVIDNFEHVLEAARDLASILRASPGTRIVVTSRAPLRIQGEQEYPLGPLVELGAGAELFVQRARAVRPDWDPGPNASVVEEVCSLLDGLPLGLELAATRVAILPVTAIRDRLAARLPLPGAAPRDVPGRQRTLDATIGWSHDLLGPAEQRLLHDLAVFEGSFDLDQATLVHGTDVLDALGTLVEHSLVVSEAATGGGVRYRLLQTIRTFALERVAAEGRERDLRTRHAEAYLALLREAAPHLPGSEQAAWLDRLSLDRANIRAAVVWAIDVGDVTLALHLVAIAWRFWQQIGDLIDGGELTSAALAAPGADAPTVDRLWAVTAAGGIAYWRGDVAEATRLYEEERDLAVRLADRAAEADAHFNLMFTHNMKSGVEAAAAEADLAMELYTELGDQRGQARVHWTRGTLRMQEGNVEEAIRIFEQSLAAFERLDDGFYHAIAVGGLAWAYFAIGDTVRGTEIASVALVESWALRDVASTTITLAPASRVALELGMKEEAAVLFGAFENLCELYGVKPPSEVLFMIAGGAVKERLKEDLDPEDLAQAKDRGRRMSVDQAVDLLVDVTNRAQPRT